VRSSPIRDEGEGEGEELEGIVRKTLMVVVRKQEAPLFLNSMVTPISRNGGTEFTHFC
jgi:hypothetical protein